MAVDRSRPAYGLSERRVLRQDLLLELLQRRRRVDPELVDEGVARVLVRLERLRLPACPVEGEHQLTAQTLAQRMFFDQRLQLADELAVAAEREICLNPLLETGEPQLLEPRDRPLRPRLVRELGERRSPPERECLAQAFRGRLRSTLDQILPPLSQQPLE